MALSLRGMSVQETFALHEVIDKCRASDHLKAKMPRLCCRSLVMSSLVGSWLLLRLPHQSARRGVTSSGRTEISKYAAAGGPNGVSVALSVAFAYMDMERKAAAECHGTYQAIKSSLDEQWKYVGDCLEAVEGTWNEEYKVALGSMAALTRTATPAPVSHHARTMVVLLAAGRTNFCATQENPDVPDFVLPVLKCMFAKNPQIGELFAYYEVMDKFASTPAEIK